MKLMENSRGCYVRASQRDLPKIQEFLENVFNMGKSQLSGPRNLAEGVVTTVRRNYRSYSFLTHEDYLKLYTGPSNVVPRLDCGEDIAKFFKETWREVGDMIDLEVREAFCTADPSDQED